MAVPLPTPQVDWNHLLHYHRQPPALTLHCCAIADGGGVWHWPLVPPLHFADGVPAGVSSGRTEGRWGGAVTAGGEGAVGLIHQPSSSAQATAAQPWGPGGGLKGA